MKVFDCFPWAGETDMLECRLRELENSPVYRHVLVEAPVTHRGPARELVFPDCKERFAPWIDRITYVVAELDPAMRWDERIRAQRDACGEGLEDASPDDIILLSDVDEIITRQAVEAAMRGEPLWFQQRLALFCVDWEAPHPWGGPSSAPLSAVDTIAGLRGTGRQVTEGAGWHLTWLGGPDAVRAKTGRYGHCEQDQMIEEGLQTGRFLVQGNTWEGQCVPRAVDSSWPRWVYERGCPPNWFREYWQRG